MFGLCRRTLVISLLFIVLTTQAQNDLNLVFRTTLNEYIAFEGEDILIECSYSMQMQNTVISLYYDSGQEIVNSTTRRVTATLRSVSNSPTVYCNVSGAAEASAQFTIKTIPRAMSPYCVSNYTEGVIQNIAIKLSCYVDTRVSAFEQWRTIDDNVLMVEERLSFFVNTRRTVSTVVPTLTSNGTKYTCDTFNVQDGSISASCEVGPILVYENILTYIDETGFPDIKNLSHGDSRNFRCVSIPSSNITWVVLEPTGDVGIVVSNGGPVLTVTVPINVTYVGIFSALCIGTLDDNRGVASLILDIVKPSDEQFSTVRTTATPLPTGTGDSPIVYIICGAVGGVVIILLIVLFTFYWCRRSKRRGKRGSTTKPADTLKQDIEEPEYANPPIGMATLDDVANIRGYTAEVSEDDDEPDHYETEGGLYTAVNKQTEKQSNAKFATVVPPSKKTHPQSYTDVDRNHNGEFNLTSDINASVSMGDNRVNISEPPNYATVDKNRHVSINEGSLDDENSSITGDYSEFQ